MFLSHRFMGPARTKIHLFNLLRIQSTVETKGGTMGEVTNEQVNLMLRLFEERREAKLRDARDWFAANFHVKTEEDLMRVCPPGSQGNTYMRSEERRVGKECR